MKPAVVQRTVESSGGLSESQFGISTKDPVHLMMVMRDTLYSNKILAVLREYSSNAWDAHAEAGCPDKPIKVVLPTELDPSLRIRDYGLGMSDYDVHHVYTQYGASTKRSSNVGVGFLGLGSKSAFAYSDSFTITSWYKGTKSIFVAVLDETNRGKATKLHEEPCDLDETGIEIKVPVNPQDIRTFQVESRWLYRFFRPTPDINLDIRSFYGDEKEDYVPHDILFQCEHGVLVRPTSSGYSSRPDWHVVMGCLAYPLDPKQAGLQIPFNTSGVLYCDIGEVTVSASRESLEYRKETVAALQRRYKLLVEAVENQVMNIRTGSLTPWEKRMASRDYRHFVPSCQKDGYTAYLYPGDALPNHFHLEGFASYTPRKSVPDPSVEIHKDTKIVLVDINVPVGRIPYSHKLRLVQRKPTSDWDDMLKELEQYLDQAQVRGVPIVNLSELELEPLPERSYNRQENPKHKLTRFLYDHSQKNSTTHSEKWQETDEEPTDEDVFLIIHRFQPVGSRTMGDIAKEMEMLSSLFNISIPPLYGIKTTAKKPVTPADVEGIEYEEWLKQTLADVVQARPEIYQEVQNRHWHSVCDELFYTRDDAEGMFRFLEQNLGEEHPVVQVFREMLQGHKAHKPGKNEDWDTFLGLVKRGGVCELPNPVDRWEEAWSKYPLLYTSRTYSDPSRHVVRALSYDQKDHWIEYIQLKDAAQ